MPFSDHVALDTGRPKRRSRALPSPIRCIFSSTTSVSMGNSATRRRHKSKIYWFVRQIDEVTFGVRTVDADFLPMGEEAEISLSELLNKYAPEVLAFEETMIPAVRRTGYRFDDGLFVGGPFAANSVVVDEGMVRGYFDLATKYLMARKAARGRTTIHEILRLKTPYPGKDQFLFNEFGIRLRKIGLLETSVACYRKALNYTSRDDHLYYNLARAHYERGQWWECMEALARCFEYNPDLSVGRDLVELMVGLAAKTKLRIRYGKPPVPDGVLRRAKLLAEATSAIPQEEPQLMPVRVKRRQVLPQHEDEVVWGEEWGTEEDMQAVIDGLTG